jgi:phospholipid N-methyltransferase
MKKKLLKRGEIAAVLLLGAVATGTAINYGVKDVCGPGITLFAKEFIAHPTGVGSCTPCSKHVANQMVRFLDTKANKPLRVLEVGAGTGTFTHTIADHLKDKKFKLDVIEINPIFSKVLKKDFSKTAHVTIHEADITQWQPTQKYDIIISALPFNAFDAEIIKQILDLYEQWIVPSGRISYIELAGVNIRKPFMTSKSRAVFDEKYKVISDFKDAHLDETVTVFRNIPPIYVHHLKF